VFQRIISKISYELDRLLYLKKGLNVGNNVEIRKNVFMDRPENVFIGDNSFINYGCNFHVGNDSETTIKLKENVFVGPNVSFICVSHNIGNSEKRAGKNKYESILVNNGVWIGASSIILQGVVIGEGSIIAAGSCVNKSIPSNELWGGTPAKFIRKLNI